MPQQLQRLQLINHVHVLAQPVACPSTTAGLPKGFILSILLLGCSVAPNQIAFR